jgi:hypothetical protein
MWRYVNYGKEGKESGSIRPASGLPHRDFRFKNADFRFKSSEPLNKAHHTPQSAISNLKLGTRLQGGDPKEKSQGFRCRVSGVRKEKPKH